MDSYVAAQDQVRANLKITRSGSELLGAWKGFIDECSEGYSWDISEYRNELGVRDQIELIVESERLRKFDEHADFCGEVQALDRMFTALAHPNWTFPEAKTWWRQVVPRSAGTELAGFCQQVYGFAIAVES